MGLAAEIDDVVAAYRSHLAGDVGKKLLKRFDLRLKTAPGAARAEAITFDFLIGERLEPKVLEDASTGGADFECVSYGERFVVEVTALGDDAVTKSSGISDDLSGARAQYVDLNAMLLQLRSRVSGKVKQVRSYALPAVVVIASAHPAACISSSAGGIVEFMTGGSSIAIPVGPQGATGEAFSSTALREAAFLRVNGEQSVELCRRELSAILMLTISLNGCRAMGMLHPEPHYPLPPYAFLEVPFARIKWPMTDDLLVVEWITKSPKAKEHPFVPLIGFSEKMAERNAKRVHPE